MTFEYRDPETGDKLIARHDIDDDQKPVTVIRTTGLNDGVYVPLDRVEEVVAGIRDAARTASGQQPTAAAYSDGKGRAYCLTCAAHPGAEVPLTIDSIDPWEACAHCGRFVVDVAREAPAVGQPAEAHDTEARPPQTRWHVEGYDADEWNPCTGYQRDREAALSGREGLKRRYPDMPTRLVRETTTWTVEDETR
ncbi:hypothetical protein ACWFR1_34185 [Streptomyces sp. NPDC055103]